jgi:4-hydroxy-tetrahydrodipicolinate synthase
MKKYHGVVVPLVTPFQGDGEVDLAALEKLIGHVTSHHCHPMILGTTGEAVSMTDPQKRKVVQLLGSFKDKATLYAGVSGNSFNEVTARANEYAAYGVDVLVAHLPCYYPLSPAAMTQWFASLADESPLPLMVYNIPSTTHMSIPLEVIDSLSRHERIVGVKDSERSEARIKDSITLWKDREDFSHFTGWAAGSLAALRAGSDGIIPSSGNLMPRVYELLYQAVRKNDTQLGQRMQQISDELGDLYQHGRLLGESLAALKAMAATLGLCGPHTLPPVYPPETLEGRRLGGLFQEYYAGIIPLLDTLNDYGK